MAKTEKIVDVEEVKDIPTNVEVFGYDNKSVMFSPTDIFEMFEVAKDDYYTFKLKPLTAKDKYELESRLSKISLDGMLWAKQNGIKIATYGNAKDEDEAMGHLLFLKYMQSLDDRDSRFGLTQKHVIGLTNYKNADGKSVKFKKETDADYIADVIWDSIPDKIKDKVYDRLLEISNISQWEMRNL